MKTRRMSRSVHNRNATRAMLARGEYRRAFKPTNPFKPGAIDVQVDLPQAAYFFAATTGQFLDTPVSQHEVIVVLTDI